MLRVRDLRTHPHDVSRWILRIASSLVVAPPTLASCAGKPAESTLPRTLESPPAAARAPLDLKLREASYPDITCDMSQAVEWSDVRGCDDEPTQLAACLPQEAIEERGALTREWCRTVCPGAWSCYFTRTNMGKPAVGCKHCMVGRRPAGLIRPRAADSGASALGRYYGEIAHLEAASVFAFERLGRELEAFRAPRRLVARCARAARDEIVHARLMTGLARREGAEPRKPRVAPIRHRSLRAVALENAVEGCVRETYGAAVATWQAGHAADRRARTVLSRIARDERRHAALAWSIAAWMENRLSPGDRKRLAAAQRAAIETLKVEANHADPTEAQQAAGAPSRDVAVGLVGALEVTLWQA
jgi:hypothetical protein